MNILNVQKNERIVLNKARAKILEAEPEISNISYSSVIMYVLKGFIGGNCGKGSKTKNKRVRSSK